MKPRLWWQDKLRLLAVPIIMGVAAVGLALMAVGQIHNITANRQLLADAQAAVKVLDTKIAALSAIDESVQASDLRVGVTAIPLDQPFTQSLALVDLISDRHGLDVFQLKLETEVGLILLNFTAVGTMTEMQHFFENINRLLPLAEVSVVEATRNADSQNYQATVQIKVHFSPAPKTIGRSADPLPQLTADHLKTLNLLSGFEKISPPAAGPETDIPAVTRLFPE